MPSIQQITRNTSLIAVLTAFFASFAFALSPVQKTKSEAQLKLAVEKTKAACGNSALEATVDWDAMEKISAPDKEQFVIAVGQYSSWALECMAMVCSDKDYKAEVAKITKVVAVPEVRTSSSDLRPKFTKNGTVLQENFRYNGGNKNNCDIELKKLF